MEEQLISFETAKLTKEKGFKELSTHIYIIGHGSLKENKVAKAFGNFEDNPKLLQPITLSKGQPHLALAPTQSLLQKWLREVHKLHICVDINLLNEWYVHVYNIKNKPFEIQETYEKLEDVRFKAYEEALEKGLQEALKLI